jgi:hypothetical protein
MNLCALQLCVRSNFKTRNSGENYNCLLSFHCDLSYLIQVKRKLSYMCVMKSIKWELLMKYTAEIASDGMIYFPRFMTTGLGNQVILRLLP